MYGITRFLRRLCSGFLVCACAGAPVGAWGATAFNATVKNVGPVYVYVSGYYLSGTWQPHYAACWGMGSSLAPGYSTCTQNTPGTAYKIAWGTNATMTPLYWSEEWTAAQGDPHQFEVGFAAPPATTNTCQASKTLVNTEGGPFAQHWVAYWIDGSGQSPMRIWEGYIDSGGSQTVNVQWDSGSGHCPGQISAFGDRVGFDTPTNVVASSTNGTRNLEDPGNAGGPGNGTPGTAGTNAPTTGDLSGLVGDVKALAKEKTAQGQTNLMAQMLAAMQAMNGNIVSGNSQLSMINGNTVVQTNLATESTLKGMSNTVASALARMEARLGPTNHSEYSNRVASFMGQSWSNALAAEAGLAANPWANSFSNSVGPWGDKLGSLDFTTGGAGAAWFTSSIPGNVVASDPSPSEAWLHWSQPGMTVLGHDVRGWEWNVNPILPGNATYQAMATAVFKLCHMALVCGITFLLWWDIRCDIQARLYDLFKVPESTGYHVSVGGTAMTLPLKLIAAGVAISIIYTAGAHLVGWLGSHFVTWISGDGAVTWKDLGAALETGTVQGVFSVWIPRVTSWVGVVFPFDLAFGAITMWCTYVITRDAVLRLAYAGIKRSLPAIFIPPVVFLLFVSAPTAGAALWDGGYSGRVTLSAEGYTNRVAVAFPGTRFYFLQPNLASGGTWQVPATVYALELAGVSNYVGNLGLLDGSVITVEQEGDLFVTRPDTIARENSLLRWGTGGIATGAFFGFLSLLGWVFKRGLFPAGHWGGGE